MNTLEQKNNMSTLMNQSLHICGCCKRELPREAFYTNKHTHVPDNYCKECRKANACKHRKRNKRALLENKKPSRQIITEVEDPELRMLLIRHALKVVADSIRRKQEKEKQRALWEE